MRALPHPHLPAFFSEGGALRAKALQDYLLSLREVYVRYAPLPPVRLFVLSEKDWRARLPYPYGLPFQHAGPEGLSVYAPLTFPERLLHRLREKGFRIACSPYRLENPPPSDLRAFLRALSRGDLEEALALYQGPLLPWSQAPGVEELRLELEEALRQAVLAQGDTENLFLLAERLGEDLEVWEALLERLPSQDPRLPIVRARVARLRREYGV